MTAAWPGQEMAATRRQYAASKVPVITGLFWIIKLLTTALGESITDYLAHTYNPYLVVPLGGIAFVIALAIQLRADRYVTWIYWLTVVMVAVFGTMAADSAHIVLGIPYLVSTLFFGISLAVIFVLWQKSEKTLSIHSIYTRRRELFYWATVSTTFALGTASGDMTARTLGLGFLPSVFLFAVVFAIPAIGYWKLGMNSVLAFWFAYVVTRPLGASLADYLGIAHRYTGLGLGYGPVAFVLALMVIGLVIYLGVTGKDVEAPAGAPHGAQRGGWADDQFGGRRQAPAMASAADPMAGDPRRYGGGDYGRGDYGRGEYGRGEYGRGEYGRGEYGGELYRAEPSRDRYAAGGYETERYGEPERGRGASGYGDPGYADSRYGGSGHPGSGYGDARRELGEYSGAGRDGGRYGGADYGRSDYGRPQYEAAGYGAAGYEGAGYDRPEMGREPPTRGRSGGRHSSSHSRQPADPGYAGSPDQGQLQDRRQYQARDYPGGQGRDPRYAAGADPADSRWRDDRERGYSDGHDAGGRYPGRGPDPDYYAGRAPITRPRDPGYWNDGGQAADVDPRFADRNYADQRDYDARSGYQPYQDAGQEQAWYADGEPTQRRPRRDDW